MPEAPFLPKLSTRPIIIRLPPGFELFLIFQAARRLYVRETDGPESYQDPADCSQTKRCSSEHEPMELDD